jgi:D-lactate dehydrogenase
VRHYTKAGDRGMRYPELNSSSLKYLDLPEGCTDGKD